MRNAFVDELCQLAERNPRLVLVVGDLGYSVVEPFQKRFPDRFFNAGVAEQNMTGLAAGLASEGYHVFTYSIANFPTTIVITTIAIITTIVMNRAIATTTIANFTTTHHDLNKISIKKIFQNFIIFLNMTGR